MPVELRSNPAPAETGVVVRVAGQVVLSSFATAGPGPMWGWGGFYFGPGFGAAVDILGLSNIVLASQVWVYRLTIWTIFFGNADAGAAVPPFVQLGPTTAPLGGGAAIVPFPLESAFGASPVDIRFGPAAAVIDPGIGYAAFDHGEASSVLTPTNSFALAPVAEKNIIMPEAPRLFLPGEGFVLTDLFGATAEYNLGLYMEWGVQ